MNNYLKNEIESGREICTLLMAHNAYWPDLKTIEFYHKNYHIDVAGENTGYLSCRKINLDNYDFILMFSSSVFSEHEYNRMKEIAFNISEKKKKRVSIGYSYIIRAEERKDILSIYEIKLASFKNNYEYEETTDGISSFNLQHLAEMTMRVHDDLEQVKQKGKKMND